MRLGNLPDERQPDALPVAFRRWTPVAPGAAEDERLVFGGDAAVVGSTLIIEGRAFTVAGIAPPGFFGETLRPDPPDLWLPLQLEQLFNVSTSLVRAPRSAWLRVIGRLRPDATTVDVLPVSPGATTPWGGPDTRYRPTVYVSASTLFSPDLCPDLDPDTFSLPGDPDGTAFLGSMVVTSWLHREGLTEAYAEGERQDPVAVIARRFGASSEAQRRDYAGRLISAARACA